MSNQLVKALEDRDDLSVRRLGFWEVWMALHQWWSPRQKCDRADFMVYAKALGNEDPEKVLDAITHLAGDFRPLVGAIIGYLHHDTPDKRVDAGRARDRSSEPDALRAVAAAIANGEHVCECGCPTSRTWKRDPRWVLRCGTCDGLEQGQAYGAEDLEAEEAAA